MKTLLRSTAVVAALAVGLLVTRSANSEEVASVFGPTAGSTSTTISGLLTLGTTGAIIYFVFVKKDDKAAPQNKDNNTGGGEDAGGGYVMNEAEAEKWVEVYVRDHSEQLTADIARGYGPTLSDLAVMLKIKAEHRALFGAKLQANASELVPLANKNSLTARRAARLFERMGDILRGDAALAADLAALRG